VRGVRINSYNLKLKTQHRISLPKLKTQNSKLSPLQCSQEAIVAIDLYLIRHGLAGEHGSYANDHERPLTDEGKQKTRQVAKRLHALALRFDLIMTSPLVRAHQTAELLLEAKLSQALQVSPHLAPGGRLEQWLHWLQHERSSDITTLALVGHEPNLSAWAETLVWGEPRDALSLKKAGVIGLTLPEQTPEGNSALFWLTPPRFLL
jgi:phosphohistidine phosphatase